MPLILNCAVDFECGRIFSQNLAQFFPKTDEARPTNNIYLFQSKPWAQFSPKRMNKGRKITYTYLKKIVIADSLLNTELYDAFNDVAQYKNDTPVSSICQLGIITDFPHKETAIVPQLKA